MMFFRTVGLAVWLLVYWIYPVNADSFSDALAIYRLEKYAEAFQLMEPLAQAGDPRAQAKIGSMYYWGRGIEKDRRKSKRIFKRIYAELLDLANLGYPEAQFELGNIHGGYLYNNFITSKFWLEKAAKQNHIGAIYNLGYAYFQGKVTAQNYAKVLFWNERGAALGDAEAIANLGYFYHNGYGVEKNITTAIDYYLTAARLKNLVAQARLNLLLLKNPEFITFERLQKFMQILTDAGPKYLANIAKLIILGPSLPVATAATFDQARAGAKRGNLADHVAYIRYLARQPLVTKNIEALLGVLNRVSTITDIDTAEFLGAAYWVGLGVPSDAKAALAYLKYANERGGEMAPFVLGTMYSFGLDVPEDRDLGMKYLEIANDRGMTGAGDMRLMMWIMSVLPKKLVLKVYKNYLDPSLPTELKETIFFKKFGQKIIERITAVD